MTATDPCAYRKCAHPAVMHRDKIGACQWPWCECRAHVNAAIVAASIARHPSGKAVAK